MLCDDLLAVVSTDACNASSLPVAVNLLGQDFCPLKLVLMVPALRLYVAMDEVQESPIGQAKLLKSLAHECEASLGRLTLLKSQSCISQSIEHIKARLTSLKALRQECVKRLHSKLDLEFEATIADANEEMNSTGLKPFAFATDASAELLKAASNLVKLQSMQKSARHVQLGKELVVTITSVGQILETPVVVKDYTDKRQPIVRAFDVMTVLQALGRQPQGKETSASIAVTVHQNMPTDKLPPNILKALKARLP